MDFVEPVTYILILYRYSWQRSRPVRLERGGVYYLEALMKEGGGADHISVAVRLPRRRRPKIIPKGDLFVKPPGTTTLQNFRILTYGPSFLRTSLSHFSKKYRIIGTSSYEPGSPSKPC